MKGFIPQRCHSSFYPHPPLVIRQYKLVCELVHCCRLHCREGNSYWKETMLLAWWRKYIYAANLVSLTVLQLPVLPSFTSKGAPLPHCLILQRAVPLPLPFTDGWYFRIEFIFMQTLKNQQNTPNRRKKEKIKKFSISLGLGLGLVMLKFFCFHFDGKNVS